MTYDVENKIALIFCQIWLLLPKLQAVKQYGLAFWLTLY